MHARRRCPLHVGDGAARAGAERGSAASARSTRPTTSPPRTGPSAPCCASSWTRCPASAPAAPNNLGNYIPVAHPDTITYPGSDYYEISLRLYTASGSTATCRPPNVRGYVQTNNGTDAGTGREHRRRPTPIDWLGPVIVAQKDRPVRIKFKNELPGGEAGNLLIPVDESILGSGKGAALPRRHAPCDPSPPGVNLHGQDCALYPADPRRHPPARRPHPVDQRRHAPPVDPADRRLQRRGQPLQAGRQPLQRAGHAGSGRRRDHLLLDEPAERAPHVLPRPRLGHHPPERARRARRPASSSPTRPSRTSSPRASSPARHPARHPGPHLRGRA